MVHRVAAPCVALPRARTAKAVAVMLEKHERSFGREIARKQRIERDRILGRESLAQEKEQASDAAEESAANTKARSSKAAYARISAFA